LAPSSTLENKDKENMRKGLFIAVALVMLLAIAAWAQESRSEVSVQGTGFFTKDSSGREVSRRTTNTGGFISGYRYHLNRLLSAEANYGFDKNTHRYFSDGGESRVKSDVHALTADLVVNLPLHVSKFSPYLLGGGGAIIFHPSGNSGRSFGADTQAKGAFLYGGGTDYLLTRHFSLRAEYRGLVYRSPDFNVGTLNTYTWTHTAQPSAGVVYHF
jgi:opacity protein-like surface antigen